MPSRVSTMRQQILHRTQRGYAYTLELRKKHLTQRHNYWMYIIVASNDELGSLAFTLLVTKAAVPDESIADHLAGTTALDEAKSRLEEADETGRPMTFPHLNEGWALIG